MLAIAWLRQRKAAGDVLSHFHGCSVLQSRATGDCLQVTPDGRIMARAQGVGQRRLAREFDCGSWVACVQFDLIQLDAIQYH